MRRRSVGLFGSIELPDSIGPICMPSGTAQHRSPKDESGNFLAVFVQNSFVTYLAHQHRHGRLSREFTGNFVHRVGITLAVRVAGLQHVEIEDGWVFDAVARRVGGMNRDAMLVGINTAD